MMNAMFNKENDPNYNPLEDKSLFEFTSVAGESETNVYSSDDFQREPMPGESTSFETQFDHLQPVTTNEKLTG